MKSHPLSHLDRQPHIRNYGRYITIFPFPYPHRADAVYCALRTGLAATLKKFPFLAGARDLDADGSLRLLHSSGASKDWMRGFTKDRITARLATLVAHPGLVDNANLAFTAGGRDVYITDVRRQGAGLDWGILGQASAIRRIGWKGEGGIVVLPRTEGGKGDWEIKICLEEGLMSGVERGLREEAWLVDSAEKKVDRTREKL